MSPDDERHFTNRGYLAGCREECCRWAHRSYQVLWRLVRDRGGREGPMDVSEAVEEVAWFINPSVRFGLEAAREFA